MNYIELEKMAKSLAKSIKTEDDLSALSALSAQLTKLTVEAALGAEMEEHLGYVKNQQTNKLNARNGYTKKLVKGSHGEIEISTPRDRDSSFEPMLVKKGQSRLTQFDKQITYLYGKGMTTRDITDTFMEMYGAEVSPALVSKVTEAVMKEFESWQSRPVDEVYPIVFLDCINVSIRHDGKVIKKAI